VSLAGANRLCYITTGQTDGVFRFKMATAQANTGILIRRVDATNFIATVGGGTLRLRRFTGGVATTVGTGAAAANGDEVTVTVTGNSFEVFINGVSQFVAIDAQGNTQTSHGLYSASSAPRLNDYSMKSE
jgi:hypothetical protein